jgi:hypothetical protein
VSKVSKVAIVSKVSIVAKVEKKGEEDECEKV